MAGSEYVKAHDVYWLDDELKRYRVPQRQVAKAIGLDPASFNRSLKGTRRMTRAEFANAARFLEATAAGLGSPLGLKIFASQLDLEDVAKAAGMDRRRLEILVDSAAKQSPTVAEAHALSRPLGVTPEDLVRPSPAFVPTARPPRLDDKGHAGESIIPVFGAVHHIGDGWFSQMSDVVEQRRRPVQLEGVASAFAIFVGDPLLQPRYEPGEVLFAHGGRPLTLGRWGIVEAADGRTAIGRVEAVTPSSLVLRANADAPQVTIGTRNAHRVATVMGTWCE